MSTPLTWDPADDSLTWDADELAWDGDVPNTNNPTPHPSQSMSNDNRISAELTAAAVTAITTAIATIRTNLPFLLSLTNEERRGLPKLGDNRLALDEDAFTLMHDHPELVPLFVELAELVKDRTLRTQIDEIRLALEALLNDVESTEIVLGHELLLAYLAFYANAQQGAKRGAAGAQTVVDTLKKYFARPGRLANPAPPTPPGA